jgi:hypothetical protein
MAADAPTDPHEHMFAPLSFILSYFNPYIQSTSINIFTYYFFKIRFNIILCPSRFLHARQLTFFDLVIPITNYIYIYLFIINCNWAYARWQWV